VDRTEAIEAHVAHLTRMVDDLNEVVLRQGAEIDRLKAQMVLLLDRARDAGGEGGVILGDERPPHW
jgi:SlyX protein